MKKHIKQFFIFNKNYIIIIIFIVLSLILLFNHEPYQDEAQAWLIARDSSNFISMIHQMGYEGTPALWHCILFILTHLGLPYFLMAIVHFLIILSAVIIFINYAPFSTVVKILFIFGYYPFFEYNTIARNYALTVLFLFLIALIYKNRFKRPILYSLLIFLLANTNLYSLVIAIILSGVYIFEVLQLKLQKQLNITKKNIISFLIMLFGFLIAIYQLLPPTDIALLYNSIRSIDIIPRTIIGAFLPIPIPVINFWNSLLIFYPTTNIITAVNMIIFGLMIFLLSLLFFKKQPKLMLIYLLLFIGLFSIFLLTCIGNNRHFGLIFIIFIFCLWIANNYKELLIKNKVINKLLSPKKLTYCFVALLLSQVIASSIAFFYELNYDFSAAKKTAIFLKENKFINNETFIASYPSYSTTAILPYIPKPYSRFFCIEYKNYCSFLTWNETYYWNTNLSIDEIINRIDNAIINKNYNRVLLILNENIEDKKFLNKYNLIISFNKTIVKNESFYLYQLRTN
ncbi:MAG: hypothetical protein WC499_01695 [Patescibacteria group bacterium]